MNNINQLKYEELPNSKIIITENVYNRLIRIIGRTSWIASEHNACLFGKKIPNSETWIIDDVNQTEDYISRGTNSLNSEDYSVSFGKKSALEIVKRAKTGIGVIDVHTHPSGLIDDYRFFSGGDLKDHKEFSKIIRDLGGTSFAGLIGVDRINGNMSFSIIYYDTLNDKFYRIKDILLRTTNEYGNIVDIPLKKYGNTQLIMQSWGTYELQMQDNVREDLYNLKHK